MAVCTFSLFPYDEIYPHDYTGYTCVTFTLEIELTDIEKCVDRMFKGYL